MLNLTNPTPAMIEVLKRTELMHAKMRAQKEALSTKGFMEPKEVVSEKTYLHVLRRWNSFSPLVSNDTHSVGGGYFIKHFDTGVVIDPGIDFLDNFRKSSHLFGEIDHVFVTHDHLDHTCDIRRILTLHYEYCRAGNEKEIFLYLPESVYRSYKQILKNQHYRDLIKVRVLRLGREPFGIGELAITPVHAKHGVNDFGFVIKHEDTILLYTGDTGYNSFIEWQYENIATQYIDCTRILLANLGGFKDCEYKGKFYPAHLGRLGLVRLLEVFSPSHCIVTEFGEEMKGGFREKFVDILNEVFEDVKFSIAEIGLRVYL